MYVDFCFSFVHFAGIIYIELLLQEKRQQKNCSGQSVRVVSGEWCLVKIQDFNTLLMNGSKNICTSVNS